MCRPILILIIQNHWAAVHSEPNPTSKKTVSTREAAKSTTIN